MADVQLEHGYLKLANSLDEALLFAKFSAPQAKIARCIVRLTYGWKRLSVRIGQQELADRCNEVLAGNFRRSLRDLVREGVITVVEQGRGTTPSAYAINKDFETWGRYAVWAKTLERLFGERPETADLPVAPPPRVAVGGHPSAPVEGPPTVTPTEEGDGWSDRPRSRRVTAHGHTEGPPTVTQNSVSASGASCCEAGKTVKDSERQTELVSSGEHIADDRAGAALVLTAAANRGITERWTEQALGLNSGAGYVQHALDLLAQAEVPVAYARDAIYTAAVECSLDTPPRSLVWFAKAARDRWQKHQHKQQGQQSQAKRQPADPQPGIGGRAYLTTLKAIEDM